MRVNPEGDVLDPAVDDRRQEDCDSGSEVGTIHRRVANCTNFPPPYRGVAVPAPPPRGWSK